MSRDATTQIPVEGVAARRTGESLRIGVASHAGASHPVTSQAVEKPPGTLTKKASLNTLAAVLDLGARMLVEFTLTPLLVAGLGDAVFGVWRVLWRLVGSFSITSGRSAQALKMAVANRQSSADYEEKRRFVASAIVIWFAFVPLYWALGGIVIWLLPSMLDIPAQLILPTRWATGLLLTNMMLLSLVDIPRAVLKGENLGYKRMGLSSALVILAGVLMLGALHLGWGIAGLAVANLVTTLVTGVLFVQVARTHVAWLGLAFPSWDTLRWFFGLSWWFIAWKFVMQAMMAGDVVVLGIFASVEQVAVYSLTKYVPELIPMGVALIVSAMAPGLGKIVGAGDAKKASQVRAEVMTFTWLMLTVAGASILLWNRPFVHLWVGSEYYAGALPTLLVLVLVIQRALIRNDGNFIDLTLNVRAKTLIGLAATVISLLLAAILVGYYSLGITGLCIGLIVGRLPQSIAYPLLVGRFVDQRAATQLAAACRPVAVTLLLFGFALYLADSWQTENWLTMIGGIAVSSLAIFVAALFSGLRPSHRQRILKRLRKVVSFR